MAPEVISGKGKKIYFRHNFKIIFFIGYNHLADLWSMGILINIFN